MQQMSRRQRVALACAPIFAGAALITQYAHAFGYGDRADAAVGALLGMGIGVSIVALIKRQARC